MLILNAEKRETKLSPEKMRQTGKVPAVFYGRKEKSTPITVTERDFLKTWKQAGESTVVVLKGAFGEHETLIHDVDVDPVTGLPRHADFYVLEKGQKVKIKIPLEFVGTSPAIKELGGTLVKVAHDLEVEAAPKDLPKQIEVNIATLVDFTSRILAGDVALPQGVTLVTKADEVIASVAQFKEEKEEVAAPVDLSAIELSEKKGKEPKEGEEGAESASPSGAKPAAPKAEKK